MLGVLRKKTPSCDDAERRPHPRAAPALQSELGPNMDLPKKKLATGNVLPALGTVAGDRLTPGGGADCARDWRDAKQSRRMDTYGGQMPGPERESAESRKARFFAEQKMRPNAVGALA
jgi:hypothetical protein